MTSRSLNKIAHDQWAGLPRPIRLRVAVIRHRPRKLMDPDDPDASSGPNSESGWQSDRVPASHLSRYAVDGWEARSMRWVAEQIRPGMHCVDVGAHFGGISVYLANIVGATGIVSSYEPSPENLGLLYANAASAKYSNLIIYPVGSQSSTRILHITKLSDSNSFYAHPLSAELGQIAVRQVKLGDSLVSPPDLIKVNVEGAELEVVRA